MPKWLSRLNELFPVRYMTWGASSGLMLIGLWLAREHPGWYWLAAVGGALTLLGIRDVRQTKKAVLRNYPVVGHLRYLLEFIRPEMRQYFIESDSEAAPFSRAQRSLVYQRAKGDPDKRPFGTQLDVHAQGYEWINHSVAPSKIAFLAWHAWRDAEAGGWPEDLPEDARVAYDLPSIRHWLERFLTRFFQTSQFKRSALPNGPKVSPGGALSPRGDWRAPSDGTAAAWLAELRDGLPPT